MVAVLVVRVGVVVGMIMSVVMRMVVCVIMSVVVCVVVRMVMGVVLLLLSEREGLELISSSTEETSYILGLFLGLGLGCGLRCGFLDRWWRGAPCRW